MISKLDRLAPFFDNDILNSQAAQDYAALLAPILGYKVILERTEKQITVFGEFDAGKSTFINAVLGQPLLPMGLLPTTAFNTLIRYGETAIATTVHQGGSGVRIENTIELTELRNLQFPIENRLIDKNVEQLTTLIEVQLPLQLLQNNIVLLDTIGLNDTAYHTQQTFKVLEQTDLAIMLLFSLQGFSQSQERLAQEVQLMLRGNLVFVFNEMSQLHDSQATKTQRDWVSKKLGDHYGNIIVGYSTLWHIDAKQMLDARSNSSRNISDYPLIQFENWLIDLFASEQVDSLISNARLGVLTHKLSKALQQLSEEEDRKCKELKELQLVEEDKHLREVSAFGNNVREIREALKQIHAQKKRLSKRIKQKSHRYIDSLNETTALFKDDIDNIDTYVDRQFRKARRNIRKQVKKVIQNLAIQQPKYRETMVYICSIAFELEDNEIVRLAKQDIRKQRVKFERRTDKYFGRINNRLDDYIEQNEPKFVPSKSIEYLEQDINQLESLIDWCMTFLKEIESIDGLSKKTNT